MTKLSRYVEKCPACAMLYLTYQVVSSNNFGGQQHNYYTNGRREWYEPEHDLYVAECVRCRRWIAKGQLIEQDCLDRPAGHSESKLRAFGLTRTEIEDLKRKPAYQQTGVSRKLSPFPALHKTDVARAYLAPDLQTDAPAMDYLRRRLWWILTTPNVSDGLDLRGIDPTGLLTDLLNQNLRALADFLPAYEEYQRTKDELYATVAGIPLRRFLPAQPYAVQAAELLRNLGRFDECRSLLTSVRVDHPTYYAAYKPPAERIEELAERRVTLSQLIGPPTVKIRLDDVQNQISRLQTDLAWETDPPMRTMLNEELEHLLVYAQSLREWLDGHER